LWHGAQCMLFSTSIQREGVLLTLQLGHFSREFGAWRTVLANDPDGHSLA
jgi:hypothetical protein